MRILCSLFNYSQNHQENKMSNPCDIPLTQVQGKTKYGSKRLLGCAILGLLASSTIPKVEGLTALPNSMKNICPFVDPKFPDVIVQAFTDFNFQNALGEQNDYYPAIDQLELWERVQANTLDIIALKNFSSSSDVRNYLRERCQARGCRWGESACGDKIRCLTPGNYIKFGAKGIIDISKFLQAIIDETDARTFDEKLFYSLEGIRFAQQGDKDIALILQAESKSDHNGAFEISANDNLGFEIYRKISQDLPVIFYTVGTSDDVLNKVHKVAEKGFIIKQLELRGHGSPYGMQLGSNSRKGHFCADESQIHLLNTLLSRDATLLFRGCSTGKGESNNPFNLVNVASRALPNRQVIGLKKDAAAKLKLLDSFQRKFQWIDIRDGKDVTYANRESIINQFWRWIFGPPQLTIDMLKERWQSYDVCIFGG